LFTPKIPHTNMGSTQSDGNNWTRSEPTYGCFQMATHFFFWYDTQVEKNVDIILAGVFYRHGMRCCKTCSCGRRSRLQQPPVCFAIAKPQVVLPSQPPKGNRMAI